MHIPPISDNELQLNQCKLHLSLQIAALLLIHQADMFLQTRDGDLPVDLAKDSRMTDLLTNQMILCAHRKTYLQSVLIYYLHILFGLIVTVLTLVLRTVNNVGKLLKGAYYNYNHNTVQKISDSKD